MAEDASKPKTMESNLKRLGRLLNVVLDGMREFDAATAVRQARIGLYVSDDKGWVEWCRLRFGISEAEAREYCAVDESIERVRKFLGEVFPPEEGQP